MKRSGTRSVPRRDWNLYPSEEKVILAVTSLEVCSVVYYFKGYPLTADAEKTGVARVKEALEANDWSQLEAPLSDSEFGDFETSSAKGDDDKDLDPKKMGFGFDQKDFEGLRKAIWEASQDVEEPEESKKAETNKEGTSEAAAAGGLEDLDEDEIAKIEKMMRKLQAVREAGEGMGEEQRKRMAARAVEEVMRDL